MDYVETALCLLEQSLNPKRIVRPVRKLESYFTNDSNIFICLTRSVLNQFKSDAIVPVTFDGIIASGGKVHYDILEDIFQPATGSSAFKKPKSASRLLLEDSVEIANTVFASRWSIGEIFGLDDLNPLEHPSIIAQLAKVSNDKALRKAVLLLVAVSTIGGVCSLFNQAPSTLYLPNIILPTNLNFRFPSQTSPINRASLHEILTYLHTARANGSTIHFPPQLDVVLSRSERSRLDMMHRKRRTF